MIPQHRLVMEEQLGRYLAPQESVHHENLDRSDNRPENLRLFATQAEHMRFHQRLSKSRDPEVIAMVRAAAANPLVRQSDLPLSPTTIGKVCRENGIVWQAHEAQSVKNPALTEGMVREALLGRTTREAARLLGCHQQTLYNRFDHLLKKRKSPTRKGSGRGASPDAPALRRPRRKRHAR